MSSVWIFLATDSLLAKGIGCEPGARILVLRSGKRIDAGANDYGYGWTVDVEQCVHESQSRANWPHIARAEKLDRR